MSYKASAKFEDPLELNIKDIDPPNLDPGSLVSTLVGAGLGGLTAYGAYLALTPSERRTLLKSTGVTVPGMITGALAGNRLWETGVLPNLLGFEKNIDAEAYLPTSELPTSESLSETSPFDQWPRNKFDPPFFDEWIKKKFDSAAPVPSGDTKYAWDKSALSIREEDPLYMRPVSGILGRAFSPLTALTMLTAAPLEPGPEKRDVENIVAALKGDKDLENTVLNLNDVHPLENLGRVWSNPKTSLLTKLWGTAASPLSDAYMALTRGDHYNPFADSATVFTNEPGIVAHELGHAQDFNSGDYPGIYTFARTMPVIGNFVTPYQEYEASNRAMKTLAKTKDLSDKHLEHAGSLLSAGYGSYIGSMIPIPYSGTAAAWLGRAIGGKDSFGDVPSKGR
jgi:hypothetical protein